MKIIKIDLGDRSYDIVIGYDVVKKSGVFLRRLALGRDAVVVTNKMLERLYGKALRSALVHSGFSVKFELVPDTERSKSLDLAAALIKRIAKYDKNRKIFLIAFGGGVIGDLAGFVASVYKRGIPYAQIPTTLLAQVDSSVGGKVAVDLPVAKNLVGAFYQPKIVLSDTSLLESLSERQMISGLAEIIKYGVISGNALFSFLETNYHKILRRDHKALEYVISASVKIKARVVMADELDKKGVRAILNYGHTIGHAIEAASGYNGYNHGEAIAVGMVVAANISSAIGLMKETDAARIKDLIRCCGLPTMVAGVRLRDVYEAHLHDKKFINAKNRFVLPAKIGAAKVIEGVPDGIVKENIERSLL